MSDQRFPFNESFIHRHISPTPSDCREMLQHIGYESMDGFISDVVPKSIIHREPLNIGSACNEFEATLALKEIADKNRLFKSYIGMGYTNCITPPVIQRNIFENPGWYTAYTPYQAEIAQGRLEALLNFQTMVADLTALPMANASLLDEATAAAEAMSLCYQAATHDSNLFFVSDACHPQVIAVVKTRALPLGIDVIVGDARKLDFSEPFFGLLLSYPHCDGEITDYRSIIQKAHSFKCMVVMDVDLLSLTLLTPPGELGADVAVGSTQRFGVPLGYGGPHAAFLATKGEFKRLMPGRIVGISIDQQNNPAYRLSLQTREQHIRRAKATSNICTAQVLLAVMASMYALYHGPKGLREIASRIHLLTTELAARLAQLDLTISHRHFFDTIRIELSRDKAEKVHQKAIANGINLRAIENGGIGITLDETTHERDLEVLVEIFSCPHTKQRAQENTLKLEAPIPEALVRSTSYLTHPVFNRYHSETEMLRYIRRLEAKDLSLTTSMIPLGSCTMKLNATSEMLPVSWPEFSTLHPFVPIDQAGGYQALFGELESMLCKITGFDAISLQPNAGSQGEYTGLLVIREYHHSQNEGHRTICLIPHSAHGTNPATAIMAGMQVVTIECDESGNININDLEKKAREHSANLAALMVTYPSTHGVFEEEILQICDLVHKYGGQVYMDGANMNAQVGLCRPALIGADVCHLNLHKTFSIPHGGGGPGMGPIGVKAHLAPFLPGHPVVTCGSEKAIGAVSAAPWGSPSILLISYMYIRMMGDSGLKAASEVAILNANYIAKQLDGYYPVLFKGRNGLVAHECIIDLHPLRNMADVSVDDVAKRLMDYGFHAPTMSWPIAGTMMIEPTESESKSELDRFCEAMISIYHEAKEIKDGKADKVDNVLKNAPHTAKMVTADQWGHSYCREKAAYPAQKLHTHKYWPPVSRINNPYGDRNLICTCQG